MAISNLLEWIKVNRINVDGKDVEIDIAPYEDELDSWNAKARALIEAQEEVKRLQNGIQKYLEFDALWEKKCADVRQQTVEECAEVAENHFYEAQHIDNPSLCNCEYNIIAAIRAKKEGDSATLKNPSDQKERRDDIRKSDK